MPIINPFIPFVGQIGEFKPQESVRIQGTISQLSYGFNVNLQCGPNSSPQQDDIALQISVRYFNGYISLNSFCNGAWDKELCISPVPIKCDEKFEIVVVCELHQYKIMINGSHQCDFPQRVSYDKISHLRIEGDVSIAQISYESASKQPVVLDIEGCPETTDVQRIACQTKPVKPSTQKSSLKGLFLTIAIIGLIALIIRIVCLINLINSDHQNDNLVYKLDFKDGTTH